MRGVWKEIINLPQQFAAGVLSHRYPAAWPSISFDMGGSSTTTSVRYGVFTLVLLSLSTSLHFSRARPAQKLGTMTGEDDNQDILYGSSSSGFLYASLPGRSKTYQRPSPLRQMLQTSRNPEASTSEGFHEHTHLRSKSTTDVPDTSIAISRDRVSSDTIHSTSQNYERLRPGEIRLLRLLPAEFDLESIAASLATFMHGASPKYTAISYAWGDRKRISTIHIDGKATPVTTSLWHALMALRRNDEPVWIWVDALSINQRDVDELNSQVHVMDKIYSEADTVAACLGPQSEGDDIKLAFEFMKGATAWKPANILRSIVKRDQRRVSSVVRLFERNYWKRLWVMQEVFHAKRADVYCGSDCIPLETIFTACTTFNSSLMTLRSLSLPEK